MTPLFILALTYFVLRFPVVPDEQKLTVVSLLIPGLFVAAIWDVTLFLLLSKR